MKDFYERNQRVWIKVTRRADKSFTFATGYNGEVKSFNIAHYSHAYMPTIKEAREFAKTKAGDFV